MKTLKKFWGVALIVILLSSMLLSSVPASAANYALSNTLQTPGSAGDLSNTIVAAAQGLLDAAQSGSTIYATTDVDTIKKSVDDGATWTTCAGTGLPAVGAQVYSLVAVAPDDPNCVFVVNTQPALGDVVYYSANGGASFVILTQNLAAMDIRSIAVSPMVTERYVVIAGHDTVSVLAEGAGNGKIRQFVLPATAGAWVAGPVTVGDALGAIPAGYDDFIGVAFSPNFASDYALYAVGLVVSTGVATTGSIDLNYYHYNLNAWNDALDPISGLNYQTGVAATAFAATKAEFAFDAAFSNDDAASRIGFVALNTITAPALPGVYNFASGVAVGTAATMPSSDGVAWNGTNLISVDASAADVVAGLTVRRATPLVVGYIVSANSANKYPSNGTTGNVMFAGGAALCLSSGNNGGVAKSIDFGKTWNGVKLLNTAMTAIISAWISPDASVKYVFAAAPALHLNLWRQTAGVWERIWTLSGGVAATYLVRADDANPASVWIGLRGVGARTMYKSADSGATWTQKNPNQDVADFVVQDYNTVYVAVNAGATARVIKTTNGGYAWSNPVITMPWLTLGTASSITLVGDNKLIVTGTLGEVAYSTDGATFTNTASIGASAAVATATGLAAGDIIYAARPGGIVARWVIGTSTAWSAGGQVIGAGSVGIALSNNVLYVLDSTASLFRFLQPSTDLTAATGADVFALVAVGTNIIDVNTIIQQTTAGTTSTVWTLTATTIESASDLLTAPTTVPTLVYPLDGTIIPINSISGSSSNFLFKWNPPDVTASVPPQAYAYNLIVYMDELGTIQLDNAAPVAAVGARSYSSADTTAVTGFGVALTGPAGSAMPGQTYYWRVNVQLSAPAQTYWSDMQSFSIQQLQAIVPILSSPTNGFSYVHGMVPAFSWNPIAGVATYKFEVSKDSTFADATMAVYSTTTASAGSAIPSTVKLADNTNYFWRVKALTPAEGEWSAVSNFSIAAAVITTVPPTQAPPTLTVVLPPVTTTSIVIPPPTTTTTEVNPSYIWAIIIIGAVLVIAVIVLIVRTRRSV
jgi:hypothetical protein